MSTIRTTYDLTIERKLSILPGGELISIDIDPMSENVLFLIRYDSKTAREHDSCFGLFLYDQKKEAIIQEKDIKITPHHHTIHLLSNGFCILYTDRRNQSGILHLYDTAFELKEAKWTVCVKNTYYIFGNDFFYFLTERDFDDRKGNHFNLYRIDLNNSSTIDEVHHFNFLDFPTVKNFLTSQNTSQQTVESLKLNLFILADNTILFCFDREGSIFYTFGEIENDSVRIGCIEKFDEIGELNRFSAPSITAFSDQEYLLSWPNKACMVQTYSLKKNEDHWEIKKEDTFKTDETLSTSLSSSLPPPFFIRVTRDKDHSSYELVESGTTILHSFSDHYLLSRRIRDNKRYIVEGDQVLLASFVKRKWMESLEEQIESNLPTLPKPLINIVTSYLHGDSFFSRRSSSPSSEETHLSITHKPTSRPT